MDRQKRLEYLRKEMKLQEQRNRTMEVHGMRLNIPLRGRQVDAVFYEAPVPNAPLVISVHGGGFMLGGCALDDDVHCVMRDMNQINILSLEYRKGPEHPFPQGLNDVYESVQWIMEHADTYRFDPKRVVLMGIGAGALLSLSCMILAYRRRDMRVRGVLAFEPLLFLHCYDPGVDTIGELREHIHLPEGTDAGEWNEEIIGAEWVRAAGINEEMLQDPLFMPLFANADDIDPALRISLIFSDNSYYKARLQSLIHNMQESGAYVEWHAAPTKKGPGALLDWSFLAGMMARLF